MFQTRDGLNAVPSTQTEKQDCQKILTPLELHQITIGTSCLLVFLEKKNKKHGHYSFNFQKEIKVRVYKKKSFLFQHIFLDQ